VSGQEGDVLESEGNETVTDPESGVERAARRTFFPEMALMLPFTGLFSNKTF